MNWSEAIHLFDTVKRIYALGERGDDLCWMTDAKYLNEVFVAVGLPPRDLHCGGKEAMLNNCGRYVGSLVDGGPWLPYAELENRYAELEAENQALKQRVAELKEHIAYLDLHVVVNSTL